MQLAQGVRLKTPALVEHFRSGWLKACGTSAYVAGTVTLTPVTVTVSQTGPAPRHASFQPCRSTSRGWGGIRLRDEQEEQKGLASRRLLSNHRHSRRKLAFALSQSQEVDPGREGMTICEIYHMPTSTQVTPIARLTGEYEVLVVPLASPHRTLDSFVKAWSAVRPHAAVPTTIREAAIGPRDGLPGGIAGQLGPFLILFATAAYVALNLVYLAVLPLATVRTSTRVAADAADAVLGRGGSALLAALVMVSSLGALIGIVLTGPRVYYSMAQDGLAFRWLTHVHPKHQTPDRAILAQAVWATVLVATGVYRDLFTRVIYTEWLFFALMAAGLFVLRRRPDYNPPYRTWGYPLLPIVFIIASLAIVVNQIASEPIDAAAGLALVAAGVPVYYLAHARR